MSFEFEIDDELDQESDVDYGEYAESDEDGSFHEIDFDALGIDPVSPTGAKPGSEQKVLMLAARYAAGVPLWHNEDCYDHGPITDESGRTPMRANRA